MADHWGLHLNPVIRRRTLTESVRLQMQGINATDRANGLISQPSARSPTTSDDGGTCRRRRQAGERRESGTSSQRAIVSTHNFIVSLSCMRSGRPTDRFQSPRYKFYDLFWNGVTLLRLLIRERQQQTMCLGIEEDAGEMKVKWSLKVAFFFADRRGFAELEQSRVKENGTLSFVILFFSISRGRLDIIYSSSLQFCDA